MRCGRNLMRLGPVLRALSSASYTLSNLRQAIAVKEELGPCLPVPNPLLSTMVATGQASTEHPILPSDPAALLQRQQTLLSSTSFLLQSIVIIEKDDELHLSQEYCIGN